MKTETVRVAVIAAAGESKRFCPGANANDWRAAKQFQNINGNPVLWHSAQPFLHCAQIAAVRIIVADESAAQHSRKLFPGEEGRVTVLPLGGKTRAQTIANGIADLQNGDWVLTQDAARPCLAEESLRELILRAEEDDCGGILAVALNDALKEEKEGRALATVARANKWRAQTPQMFRAGDLRRALAKYPQSADESEAMEREGFAPLIVPGRADNIKITTAQDLLFAAAILSARANKEKQNEKEKERTAQCA